MSLYLWLVYYNKLIHTALNYRMNTVFDNFYNILFFFIFFSVLCFGAHHCLLLVYLFFQSNHWIAMVDWISLFVSVLIICVYGCLFCMYLCLCTMCMQSTHRNLKGASDPLQFVLQTDVSFHAGPWKQIRVLWKHSLCSEVLIPLPSLAKVSYFREWMPLVLISSKANVWSLLWILSFLFLG